SHHDRQARKRDWYCPRRSPRSWPRPSSLSRSSQLDVPGMDELERAVAATQAECSVPFDPVETARDCFVSTRMDRQPRAKWVRPSEPRLRQERRLALAPKFEQAREAAGEQGCERFRRDPGRKRCASTVRKHRGARQIHSKADRDSLAAPLEEDSREFAPEQHQVVGPFEHQRATWRRYIDCFNERQAGDQRQALCRRVATAQPNERTAVEIAFRGNPNAALATPARLLVKRDEPVALGGLAVGEEVGVGRTGTLDDSDSSQNRLPAALSLRDPSGPISK